MKYDVAVIGAGASGLMCACYLTYLKKTGSVPTSFQIILIERNDRPGKKLLLTGSGRCNITNINASGDVYNTDSPDTLNSIINSFTSDDLLKFASEELGLDTINKDSLIYPSTLRSATVLDALRFYLSDNGVEILTDRLVTRIDKTNDSYKLGFDGRPDESVIASDVVVATGGMSYPKTGSDGNGYSFGGNTKLVNPRPALVPLKSSDKDIRSLSGTSVTARVSVNIDGMDISEEGSLLFTDYGISGICVMILSGKIAEAASINGKYPRVSVDFLSSFDREASEHEIRSRIDRFSDRKVCDALSGLLRNNIIEAALKRNNIPLDKTAGELTDTMIANLIDTLKAFKINICGNTGFDNSQVTMGGLALADLGPELISSDGIFFCGEIVNVDGPCGGYNLHWAWSSAVTVARSIGKKYES